MLLFFLYLLYFALFQNVVRNSDYDVKNIVSDVIMLTLWVLNVNIFSQSRYICNKVDRLIKLEISKKGDTENDNRRTRTYLSR